MEITRHFTATTLIVFQDRVLLHFHKKLKLWLPVGGHIDRDELPEEAALREIKEETGLEVELMNFDPSWKGPDAVELHRPVHLLLENINPFHQHIDFIYYAKSLTSELKPEDGESVQFQWLNEAELGSLSAPDNVKVFALEALQRCAVDVHS